MTDILTFDLRDSSKDRRKNEFVADIFICPSQATANAKIFKTSLKQEVVLYVIHGILHLLGYDDRTPLDIKKMRAKEREVLERLKRRNIF